MWNVPSINRLNKIPALGTTDKIPFSEKKIHLHFFTGGSDWYVAEFDGEDTFFGFVCLNNDTQNAEWGYFTFSELIKYKSKGLGGAIDCERAVHFPIKKVKDIPALQNIIK